MTDEKKIGKMDSDKNRLFEALRELKKQGVTLIDDRVGRPAIISAKPRADVVETQHNDAKSTKSLLLDSLDRMFVEDGTINNDPYNRSFK